LCQLTNQSVSHKSVAVDRVMCVVDRGLQRARAAGRSNRQLTLRVRRRDGHSVSVASSRITSTLQIISWLTRLVA